MSIFLPASQGVEQQSVKHTFAIKFVFSGQVRHSSGKLKERKLFLFLDQYNLISTSASTEMTHLGSVVGALYFSRARNRTHRLTPSPEMTRRKIRDFISVYGFDLYTISSDVSVFTFFVH